MAANDQRIISLPPATQSSQPHSSPSASPKLTESLIVHTDDDTNSLDAESEPNCSDANSTHSQSPSSNFRSSSISFSYEKSQIGQFYMEQEAAKKSRKYAFDAPSFALFPKIQTNDEEAKDHDDDETMNRILINYRKQESATKDIRRGIASRNVFSLLKSKKKSSSNKKSTITFTKTRERASTIHSLAKSADFSENQVPLQTRIAQWRGMTDNENLTPVPMAPAPIFTPKLQHFNSGPVNNQCMNAKHGPWNDMMIGSMTPDTQVSRNRSSAINPKQNGPTISSFGFCRPDISLTDSDEDIENDKDKDAKKSSRFTTDAPDSHSHQESNLNIEPIIEVGEYIQITLNTKMKLPLISRDEFYDFDEDTKDLMEFIEEEEFDSEGLEDDIDCYDDINNNNYNPKQSNIYINLLPKDNTDKLFKNLWGTFINVHDDNGFNANFDSDKDNEGEDDEKAIILKEADIKADQKQVELAIQRTTQLVMVSNRNSKEVFQSLWNVCISLKKDPEYHISFNDELLRNDHVESFLRLLGFVKIHSSLLWSCFAHTRVDTSLIDTAILECHKCRQIIQQRGSTLNLIRQLKKNKKNSDTSRGPQLNLYPAKTLSIVQQSTEISQTVEESHAISIDARDNGDSVQLYELIWGITHYNNDDPGAKDILLLCYPLVTNAKYILYCLQGRFFKDDHDGRKTLDSLSPIFEYGTKKPKYDRILSSFSVQAQVIEFIRHWMVRFWDQDWDSNRKLMSYCKVFMKRIRRAYQSEENQEYYEPWEIQRGLRLVQMLENTLKTQKTHKKMRFIKIFGESSDNHGLLSSDNGVDEKRTGHKKKPSLFFRGISAAKLNKGPKNLMDVNCVNIAETITLLQFNLFKKIHPRECLKQAWKNNETKHKIAPNVIQYIEAFNQLTKWIQSSILSMKDVKSRGRTMKRWVKVEEELLKLRNFQGLCAVYGGLASTPIYRLKEAWSYVPKKHITQHEEIHVIMKPSGNWRNLRSLQLQTHPPMLPYFGMFAKDMIAIEETTNNRSNDGTINWDALCRGQATIDKHLHYQNSQYKNLNVDLSIQRWMNKELTMSGKLDDEWIYQTSDNALSNDKHELGKDNKTKTPKKRVISLWKSK